MWRSWSDRHWRGRTWTGDAYDQDPFWSNVSLLIQPETSSASITDLSLNSNTVSVFGNAASDAATPFTGLGASVALDGTGDYLTVPTGTEFDFSTGDLTVEAWVRPTANPVSPGYQIFAAQASGGLFFGINAFSSPFGLGFGRVAVAWDFVSGVGLTLNTWQHIALTRSGTDMRIFKDGVQCGATQTNSTSWDLAATALRIGYDGSKYLQGQITGIRVTKSVARYTAAFTPPTKPFPTQ